MVTWIEGLHRYGCPSVGLGYFVEKIQILAKCCVENKNRQCDCRVWYDMTRFVICWGKVGCSGNITVISKFTIL